MFTHRSGRSEGESGRGFTIIEVVLVLALAGLIFLMIFLALPTLQRSQRDQQRRNDLSEFNAAVVSWQATQRKKLDTQAEAEDLIDKYMGNQNDPTSTDKYEVIYYPHTSNHTDVLLPPLGTIVVVGGHICGSDADNYPGGSATLITGVPGSTVHDTSLYSVLMRLEATNTEFCIDNY